MTVGIAQGRDGTLVFQQERKSDVPIGSSDSGEASFCRYAPPRARRIASADRGSGLHAFQTLMPGNGDDAVPS